MVRRLPVLPKLPKIAEIETQNHSPHRTQRNTAEQPGTKSQSILRLSPRLRVSAVKILICAHPRKSAAKSFRG